MYPLHQGQIYPRNQWWVGATSHEVTRTPMQRIILGEPVVFYRTEAGMPVAMFGLCPHRLYPMIKGKLKGDAFECGYHGFTFNDHGTCTRVPTQDNIPKGFKIRVYPVVEKDEWIWIWTGESALADPAQIPDPFNMFKEGWRTDIGKATTHHGRYQTLIDNLYDLSHLGFIHASFVGDVQQVVKAATTMGENNGIFRLTRNSKDNPYSPVGDMMFGPNGGSHYDSVLHSDYYGPSLIMTGGPFTQRAEHSSTGLARHIGALWFAHAITPETPTTTYYFSGRSRDYRLDDDAYSAFLGQMDDAIRRQDVDAFGLIEPWIDSFASTEKEISALQDSGAIRVRRLLVAQIAAEQELMSRKAAAQ